MGKALDYGSPVSFMCDRVEHYMEIAELICNDKTPINSADMAQFGDWIKSLDKVASKLRGKKRKHIQKLFELSVIHEVHYEAIAIDIIKTLQLMSRQLSQREIIELRLDVGLWLEVYKGFVKFIKEVEVLENLLK